MIAIFNNNTNMLFNFRKHFLFSIKKNNILVYGEKDFKIEGIYGKKINFNFESSNIFFLISDLFKVSHILFNNNKINKIVCYTVRMCFLLSILKLIRINRLPTMFFIAGLGRYGKKSILSNYVFKIISKSSTLDNSISVVLNNMDFKYFKSLDSNVIKLNSEGLDIKQYYFQQTTYNGILRVAYIGRPLREKGFTLFCEIAEKFKSNDIEFYYYGPMIDNLPNNVFYKGFSRNINSDLKDIDLVILLSTLNEGCPRVLLESIISGRGVITYKNRGIIDVISKLENSDLYYLRDVNEVDNKFKIWRNLLETNNSILKLNSNFIKNSHNENKVVKPLIKWIND